MIKEKALQDQFPPPIVRDILTVLNSCVPFIVRFNKDHSLKGRVFSFEAIRKTTDYELRIYTEYPIGKNNLYNILNDLAYIYLFQTLQCRFRYYVRKLQFVL